MKVSLRFAALVLTWVLVGFCGTASLTGCSAAAYGLGVATMVNDMKARQREDYANYRRQAEAENAPRIMTFSEWLRAIAES